MALVFLYQFFNLPYKFNLKLQDVHELVELMTQLDATWVPL